MKAPFLFLTLIIVTILGSADVSAQEVLQRNKFSIGISAGNLGFDSGIGIELSTPSVFNGFCIRIKGGTSWLESYKAVYDHWRQYQSLSAAMVYNTKVADRAILFFELGTYLLVPDQKFSTYKNNQGVFGTTGIELVISTKPSAHTRYFFCGGLGYIKAYADKMENEPRYGNGLIFNNGFRYYF
jgi:hypothetical protein